MSYCKYCGTNVENSNFCPTCGHATAEPTQPTMRNDGFSEHYPTICEYSSNATKMLIFGILSLVFCMGIGLIFEIICIVIGNKLKKIADYSDKLTNPTEIEMYNAAKSRHKTGVTLSAIAIIITGILLFVLILGVLILLQID